MPVRLWKSIIVGKKKINSYLRQCEAWNQRLCSDFYKASNLFNTTVHRHKEIKKSLRKIEAFFIQFEHFCIVSQNEIQRKWRSNIVGCNFGVNNALTSSQNSQTTISNQTTIVHKSKKRCMRSFYKVTEAILKGKLVN